MTTVTTTNIKNLLNTLRRVRCMAQTVRFNMYKPYIGAIAAITKDVAAVIKQLAIEARQIFRFYRYQLRRPGIIYREEAEAARITRAIEVLRQAGIISES